MAISPRSALPVLVDALAREGWGDLDGRAHQGLRSTLRAVVAIVDHTSGGGRCTVGQVADATGLSDRWTRRCLHALEQLGLIAWHRGWLDKGRPRPGYVRVHKVALYDRYRRAFGTALTRATARTHARIDRVKRLRVATIYRQHAKPLAVTSELSSTLPPYGEGTRSRSGPETNSSAPESEHMSEYMSACPHGEPTGPEHCGICRHQARQDAVLIAPTTPQRPGSDKGQRPSGPPDGSPSWVAYYRTLVRRSRQPKQEPLL